MTYKNLADWALNENGRRFPYKGNLMAAEFEFEFLRIPQLPNLDYATWQVKTDGSLRLVGREICSITPVTQSSLMSNTIAMVKELKKEPPVTGNGRCGTHLHYNMQDKTFNDIIKRVFLYWCLQEAMVEEFLTEDRLGNNYCITYRSNPGIVRLLNFINGGRSPENVLLNFDEGHHKYSGLNLASLPRIGTLEVRSYGELDLDNPGHFFNWLQANTVVLCSNIVDRFESPLEIPELLCHSTDLIKEMAEIDYVMSRLFKLKDEIKRSALILYSHARDMNFNYNSGKKQLTINYEDPINMPPIMPQNWLIDEARLRRLMNVDRGQENPPVPVFDDEEDNGF